MANLDISSLIGMLSGDGISALGKSADAKSSQVSGVLDSALPLLLSGMKDNASTKAGAASLNKALKDHAKDDTADIGSFLQNVDLADGGKILTHILGDNKKTAVDGIAKKNGISSDQVTTILSSLAPLLLTKLGSSKADEDDDDGAGLTDLLGSLLSGGTSTKKKSSSKKNSSASALGNLLGSLLGSSSDEDEEEEEATQRRATELRFLAKVSDAIYVQLNRGKDIQVSQIASAMCMSDRQFYRKINALTGSTPTVYIQRVKIKKAKGILDGDSQMSFSEIAVRCGFNDYSNFVRTFKNTYGVTPTEYRRGNAGKL